MHQEVRKFVKAVRRRYPLYFVGADVLEFGSLNVNGTVRDYFYGCNYVGVDVGEGPGVDVQCSAADWNDLPGLGGVGIDKEFDVVISTEMLEHDERWSESICNMYDALKPGGLLIITCAGPERPEHGTKKTDIFSSPFTTDHYRNITVRDIDYYLPSLLFYDFHLGYRRGGNDTVLYGIKKGKQYWRNHKALWEQFRGRGYKTSLYQNT